MASKDFPQIFHVTNIAPISHLAHLMFRTALNEGQIAVLAAFFDDSGTHSTAPVMSMGGVLGTDEQWAVFDQLWARLLVRPFPDKPSLKQFHLAPCRAGDGEFLDYNEAERDRITYLFRQIILDVGLVTIACTVNLVAWNELVVGKLAEILGSPLNACFSKCVDSVLDTIRIRKPGQKVALIFDQATQKDIGQFAYFYKTQSAKYPELNGLGFANVADVMPLQAADMVATESYYYAQQWLRDRDNAIARAHFQDYLKRDLSVGLVLDRDHIQEMVQRVESTL